MMAVIYILIALIVLAVLVFVGMYNGLVRLRNVVRDAWAQIDVQLKRRHDLIPNLVETVRGYMVHERETLENVTKARQLAQGAGSVQERGAAEQALTAALGRLFAVVENYPNLKANENFLHLQEEITSTENKVGFARQFYNDSVMRFNNKIQVIPSNVVASMCSFRQADFFQLESEAEREAPKVDFS